MEVQKVRSLVNFSPVTNCKLHRIEVLFLTQIYGDKEVLHTIEGTNSFVNDLSALFELDNSNDTDLCYSQDLAFDIA